MSRQYSTTTRDPSGWRAIVAASLVSEDGGAVVGRPIHMTEGNGDAPVNAISLDVKGTTVLIEAHQGRFMSPGIEAFRLVSTDGGAAWHESQEQLPGERVGALSRKGGSIVVGEAWDDSRTEVEPHRLRFHAGPV